MAFCKSCGAQIVWVKTKAGKAMPCDAHKVLGELDPNGKDILVTEDGEVVKCNTGMSCYTGKIVVGYTSHFATCPYADKHRRK